MCLKKSGYQYNLQYQKTITNNIYYNNNNNNSNNDNDNNNNSSNSKNNKNNNNKNNYIYVSEKEQLLGSIKEYLLYKQRHLLGFKIIVSLITFCIILTSDLPIYPQKTYYGIPLS